VTAVGGSGTVCAGMIAFDVPGVDIPAALVAVTVQVYTSPSTSPVTWIGLAVALPVPVGPLTVVQEALKVMMGLPLFAPGVNAIDADACPAVAVTFVGAAGTLAGVKALDACDAPLVPAAFVAVTVQVYASPFVKPDTTTGLAAFDPVPGVPVVTGAHVAEKFVMRLPLLAPGVNATVADPFPGVAVTLAGAAGAAAGVAAPDGADGKLGPLAFVATTVHVYASPFVKPATVTGAAVLDPVPGVPALTGEHVAV